MTLHYHQQARSAHAQSAMTFYLWQEPDAGPHEQLLVHDHALLSPIQKLPCQDINTTLGQVSLLTMHAMVVSADAHMHRMTAPQRGIWPQQWPGLRTQCSISTRMHRVTTWRPRTSQVSHTASLWHSAVSTYSHAVWTAQSKLNPLFDPAACSYMLPIALPLFFWNKAEVYWIASGNVHVMQTSVLDMIELQVPGQMATVRYNWHDQEGELCIPSINRLKSDLLKIALVGCRQITADTNRMIDGAIGGACADVCIALIGMLAGSIAAIAFTGTCMILTYTRSLPAKLRTWQDAFTQRLACTANTIRDVVHATHVWLSNACAMSQSIVTIHYVISMTLIIVAGQIQHASPCAKILTAACALIIIVLQKLS